MENLYINISPEQIYYPVVDFNYEMGTCEIAGESYMEESYKFYEPMINWLNNFTAENRPIKFNFKLTYFNTSSSRFILEILDILKNYKIKGGIIEVNWFYKIDDPDILTEIEDFIKESSIEIKVIPF